MQCTHTVRLKNICCICGTELFDQKDEFCALFNNELLKTTEYKKGKLALIIDLDETIVHTCFYYKSDFTNQINQSDDLADFLNLTNKKITINNRNIEYDILFEHLENIYLIKLRPNTILFLKEIGNIFDIYIFSMGQKGYVEKIKDFLVKNNISIQGSISRDDNFSFYKSVKRIGLSDRRVIVLDDRIDIWNYFESVILIRPFVYYKEDILLLENNEDILGNNNNLLDETLLLRNRDLVNNTVFNEDLLTLLPLLKKINKKFKKIKNTKKIMINFKEKLFRKIKVYFNFEDPLIFIAKFFHIKFINQFTYEPLLGNEMILEIKGKLYVINKQWLLECVYNRKVLKVNEYIIRQI